MGGGGGSELSEPAVALRPMAAGGEVVEDYGHVGLTLRAHPVRFLRESLTHRRFLTCAEATRLKDRQKGGRHRARRASSRVRPRASSS